MAAPDTDPTPAQIEAGNYRKGHIKYQGLDITIENLKGSKRRGVDSKGKSWESTLPADYGYIKRTVGADKDHLDVYVGPNKDAFMVWVVNQKDLDTGKFDEHKCMLGFKTKKEAIEIYVKGFNDGKGLRRIISVKSMTVPKFKEWIKEKDNMTKQAATRAYLRGYFDKVAEGGLPYKDDGFVDQDTLAMKDRPTPAARPGKTMSPRQYARASNDKGMTPIPPKFNLPPRFMAYPDHELDAKTYRMPNIPSNYNGPRGYIAPDGFGGELPFHDTSTFKIPRYRQEAARQNSIALQEHLSARNITNKKLPNGSILRYYNKPYGDTVTTQDGVNHAPTPTPGVTTNDLSIPYSAHRSGVRKVWNRLNPLNR